MDKSVKYCIILSTATLERFTRYYRVHERRNRTVLSFGFGHHLMILYSKALVLRGNGPLPRGPTKDIAVGAAF
jgi:hypothetical protein